MKILKKHQIKQLSPTKRHVGYSYIVFHIKIEKIILITPIENYLIHINQTNKKE